MIIYLIPLILSIIGAFFVKNKTIKKWLYYIICLVVILIVGLRSSTIGSDTRTYELFFNKITFHTLDTHYFEFGYMILNATVRAIADNYSMFLLVVSAISYASIFYIIKKYSANYFISITLLISLMFMYDSMNIMRQFLAISIVFLSSTLAINRKPVKFILAIALATSIHTSAIIGLLLYPIIHAKTSLSLKNKLLLVVATLFISFFGQNILSAIIQKTGLYLDYEYRLGTIKLASTIALIRDSLLLLYINCQKAKNDKKFRNIAFIALLLRLLSLNLNIIGRVASYFDIFYIVSVPNSIMSNEKNKNRLVFAVLTISLSIAHMLVILSLRPEWYNVIPYSTFWMTR